MNGATSRFRPPGGSTVVRHDRFLDTDLPYALVASEDEDLSWDWARHDAEVNLSVLRGDVAIDVRSPAGVSTVAAPAGSWARIPAGVEHRVRGRGLFELFGPRAERGDVGRR